MNIKKLNEELSRINEESVNDNFQDICEYIINRMKEILEYIKDEELYADMAYVTNAFAEVGKELAALQEEVSKSEEQIEINTRENDEEAVQSWVENIERCIKLANDLGVKLNRVQSNL